MSALELEIREKIEQLEPEARQRVIDWAKAKETISKPPFDWETWLREAEAFGKSLTAKYGENHFESSVALLHEAREERLNDIMDSL